MTPHPDGLAAAKAKATPGQCIFCEEPLPATVRGRSRVICDERGCKTAYMSAWRRDHPQSRQRDQSAPAFSEWTTWHCGCGKVCRRSGWGSHKKSCMFAVDAFPVVVMRPRRDFLDRIKNTDSGKAA